MKSNLTGTQKIALLTRTLGYSSMLQVIRSLDLPDEVLNQIDKDTPDTVSKNDAIEVLREFNTAAKIVVGGKRESLVDALDDLGSTTNGGAMPRRMHGFKKLSAMEPESIYQLIRKEQPLHLAIILFELPESVSVDVFERFSVVEQAQITEEAERAESPSRETLHAINVVIEQLLDNHTNKGDESFNRIMAFTGAMDEEYLEEFLAALPEDVATKIRNNVLTFTQVFEQDERVLSEILGEVSTIDLAYAFCLFDEAQLVPMYEALTKTKQQDVKFNMEKSINKDDKKAISAAQRVVINKAKELQTQGKIELTRS